MTNTNVRPEDAPMDKKTMDKKTMDKELDKLVEDSGFLRYHAEYAKQREFNAFDVLRYAEYEIRHSNVLGWLLDPGETHGVGRAFLDRFLGEVNESITDRGEQRVRVYRELHYVDVTVFLESARDRHIVAIENKPGGYSPEHLAQVCGYAKELRKKYPDYTLHNVLLTTSREVPVLDVAGVCGPDVPKNLRVTHVSWRDVGAQIKEMHSAGAFEREEVAAFVRQYLAAVGRLIGPEEHDAHYFRKLLDGHRSLLRHMFEVLVNDGDDRVRATVPDRHAHYRGTVVRLVRDFGQEPGRLLQAVRQMLTDRGMETKKWGSWLYWGLEEAEALGSDGSYIRWCVDFQYREVCVDLEVPPYGRGETVNRILAFMRETPVDRRHRDRYPMKSGEYNYFSVYSHRLVGDDILSGRSTAAVTEAVRREVANFLDSEDSDYKRIRDYFKCLAFSHDGAAGEEEASS